MRAVVSFSVPFTRRQSMPAIPVPAGHLTAAQKHVQTHRKVVGQHSTPDKSQAVAALEAVSSACAVHAACTAGSHVPLCLGPQ